MQNYRRDVSIFATGSKKSHKKFKKTPPLFTEAQSRAIYDRYGIDGIPYYFLVDCKGTVTPRPDFRDHDLLVSTILEELKK